MAWERHYSDYATTLLTTSRLRSIEAADMAASFRAAIRGKPVPCPAARHSVHTDQRTGSDPERNRRPSGPGDCGENCSFAIAHVYQSTGIIRGTDGGTICFAQKISTVASGGCLTLW
jgi:hypothetical protein